MAQAQTENRLKQIVDFGQSIWYDGLVSPEEFEQLVRRDGVRGATTNPTIFEKALSGTGYDEVIRALARDRSAEEIYRILSVEAVQRTADVFLPLYEKTKGKDGFVSLEVSPLLARDARGTTEEGKTLFRLAARPNVMIKVPATAEGIPAIRTLLAQGVSVNVTLIFSVERYAEVIEAYLEAFEERRSKGLDLSGVHSVASFFVSRVDTAVDQWLDERIGRSQDERTRLDLESLKGLAGIANSKRAYALFQDVFYGARFEKLKANGARVQRPLWASTGTKNPKYSDVMYVEALMGPETVNTIPPATLDAFRDHGVPGVRLTAGMEAAQRHLEALERAGISLKGVTADLEKNGVGLFADSYLKLIERLRAKMPPPVPRP